MGEFRTSAVRTLSSQRKMITSFGQAGNHLRGSWSIIFALRRRLAVLLVVARRLEGRRRPLRDAVAREAALGGRPERRRGRHLRP